MRLPSGLAVAKLTSEESDDGSQDGNNTVDDGHNNTGDGVDDGHDAGTNGLEAGDDGTHDDGVGLVDGVGVFGIWMWYG